VTTVLQLNCRFPACFRGFSASYSGNKLLAAGLGARVSVGSISGQMLPGKQVQSIFQGFSFFSSRFRFFAIDDLDLEFEAATYLNYPKWVV
jgi:hypothetical protein